MLNEQPQFQFRLLHFFHGGNKRFYFDLNYMRRNAISVVC